MDGKCGVLVMYFIGSNTLALHVFYFKLKRLALSSSTLCKTHKGRNDLSTDVNECWPFQITSRRPYWCPKTIKWRPCWCPKPVLWEWNSFLMQTLSFVPINMHRCWLFEWKRSIPGRIKVGRWNERVRAKGVMQWTGTLLRNVACFRLRSGLVMWFVH